VLTWTPERHAQRDTTWIVATQSLITTYTNACRGNLCEWLFSLAFEPAAKELEIGALKVRPHSALRAGKSARFRSSAKQLDDGNTCSGIG
jgi:hypothetical protein